MPKAKPSLAEYAATQKPKGTPCWLCGIPEKAEVEQAVLAGTVSKAAATRWLRDVCGYPEATANRVDNHFANHVRRPAFAH